MALGTERSTTLQPDQRRGPAGTFDPVGNSGFVGGFTNDPLLFQARAKQVSRVAAVQVPELEEIPAETIEAQGTTRPAIIGQFV